MMVKNCPAVRSLHNVQIEGIIKAHSEFTMLMGDEVKPLCDFIESNALRAMNIDA
jgi:DNA gyrase/topoisomerase IV subunit B